MKPSFALNLSHKGIILLHRSPRGTWIKVGDVSLEDAEFAENLSFLRGTAVGLEGKGFCTKLIIPDSQILYREIHAPGPSDQDRREQILAALEGQVPYEAADLSLDWKATATRDVVLAAVVANETLDEAEEFAVDHRFNPVSFVGPTGPEPDAWEPFFGKTDFSISLLGPDADVRDAPPPEAPKPDPDDLFAPEPSDPDQNETSRAEDPSPSVTPNDQTETTEPSFFAPESPATSPANIFVEAESSPQAHTSVESAPNDPTADATGEQDTPAPVTMPFASRRPHEAGEKPDETQHIVDQITPRIAIQPVLSGTASLDSDSATTPDTRLREGMRDKDRMKSREPGGFARGLASVLRRAKDGTKALSTRTLAALAQAKEQRSDAAAGQKRRLLLPVIAALVVLLAFGLGAWLLMSGSDSNQAEDSQNAGLTRAAERGVRADNRARARPSDFAAIVASIRPNSVPSPDIPLIRPERRSKFEGKTDPDANSPDTVKPVTDLSEAELAAIKAAGLTTPTTEEMAEGVEADLLPVPDTSQADAVYAKTGILQSIQPLPSPLADQTRDDIYVASIDRALDAGDAIILPNFNAGPADDRPLESLSPLPPDTVFNFDQNGFVVATAEGALNPQGIIVRLGKPAVTPPEKPQTDVLVPPDPLRALTPKARPINLKTGADAIFVQGRLTLAQLRAKRAKVRPISIQAELTPQNDTSVSELAVLTSFQPAKRPSDFSKTVEKTRTLLASATPATRPAPASNVGPVLPTRANVAKNATIRNAINLSRLNLIGVSGPSNGRKALLRLPSGRFVRVETGDRIDGGRVAAIGVDSLSYVKSGRNRVLKIPQ